MEKPGETTDAYKQLALYRSAQYYYIANKLCNSVLRISKTACDLNNIEIDQFKQDMAKHASNVKPSDGGSMAAAIRDPMHYDYLVGMADIQGCKVVIFVSHASAAMSFDNMTVFKIKQLHFEKISESEANYRRQAEQYEEEVNRISRLYTKYGYYARGNNISNTFIDIVKKHYGVPDESPIDNKVQASLARLMVRPTMEKNRRVEYSANHFLIRSIEACMKEQLWMFDVILVGWLLSRDTLARLALRVERSISYAGKSACLKRWAKTKIRIVREISTSSGVTATAHI